MLTYSYQFVGSIVASELWDVLHLIPVFSVVKAVSCGSGIIEGFLGAIEREW